MKKKYVIIGTSAAAIGVLSKLRTLDPAGDILCISDEAEMPYNKCILADFLADSKPLAATYTKNNDFFSSNSIHLVLNTTIVRILREQKQVVTQDGASITYDVLFLGTGASPVTIPAMPTHPVEGIFYFYGLEQTRALHTFIKHNSVQSALIVGAGLSGLECADALVKHGIRVTLVERNSRVLASHVDELGSAVIEAHMRKKGITLYYKEEVCSIDYATSRSKRAILSSGRCIESDIIIFALGARPNSQLASDAGLVLHQSSIMTNDYLQTSDPSICAGGDVAAVKDQLTGTMVRSCTWPDAMLQGLVAAHTMTGHVKKYPGIVSIVSSAFFDIQFVVGGIISSVSPAAERIVKQGDDFYHCYFVEDQRLKAFILVGNSKQLSLLKRLLMTQELIADMHML